MRAAQALGVSSAIRTSLPNEYAIATLLNRGFLKRLRPVRAFNQVCLPAFYGNKLALLASLGAKNCQI